MTPMRLERMGLIGRGQQLQDIHLIPHCKCAWYNTCINSLADDTLVVFHENNFLNQLIS